MFLNLLQIFKRLFRMNIQSDVYADLPAHVRKSIEISISQLEAGEGIPHSKVMAGLKKRFVK